MLFSVILLALVLVPNGGYSAIPPYRSMGYSNMRFAAFAQVLHNSATGKEDLVVSAFSGSPFTKDQVHLVQDIKGDLADEGGSNLNVEKLTDVMPWPNELGVLPSDVLGRDDIWWCGAGFLVPGRDDGYVALLEVSDTVPFVVHDISTQPDPDRTLWWYHRVEWVDMNGDGRKDALTCRAILRGSFTDTSAEMVWFEQPASGDPLTSTWQEHILFEGPDAVFRYETLTVRSTGQSYDVIISPQYFQERLVVSWIEPEGSWTDPSTIQHHIIDISQEPRGQERFFEVQLVDLNMDGNKDLLASINSHINGKLVAYEIPDDFRTESWTKHLIAEGFVPQGNDVTEANGAPGMFHAFYPWVGENRNKPLIILTGDDEANIHLFESTSDTDTTVWTYQKTIMYPGKGTTGTPAVADVDGDGFMEVFIPAYSDGTIHTYTFKP